MKIVFPALLIAATVSGCASNMSGIARDQKLNPVVIYVESCGNYKLDGMLSKYVWDSVESSLAGRRRVMSNVLAMCNAFNANIESAVAAEGLQVKIMSVTTEDAPAQEIRDRDIAGARATYALYVSKPVMESRMVNNGPTTIVDYKLYLYISGRKSPIGIGEAYDWDGAIVAKRVAHTLIERCNPSVVSACSKELSYPINGTFGD
jgi:hypothetical protein